MNNDDDAFFLKEDAKQLVSPFNDADIKLIYDLMSQSCSDGSCVTATKLFERLSTKISTQLPEPKFRAALGELVKSGKLKNVESKLGRNGGYFITTYQKPKVEEKQEVKKEEPEAKDDNTSEFKLSNEQKETIVVNVQEKAYKVILGEYPIPDKKTDELRPGESLIEHLRKEPERQIKSKFISDVKRAEYSTPFLDDMTTQIKVLDKTFDVKLSLTRLRILLVTVLLAKEDPDGKVSLAGINYSLQDYSILDRFLFNFFEGSFR